MLPWLLTLLCSNGYSLWNFIIYLYICEYKWLLSLFLPRAWIFLWTLCIYCSGGRLPIIIIIIIIYMLLGNEIQSALKEKESTHIFGSAHPLGYLVLKNWICPDIYFFPLFFLLSTLFCRWSCKFNLLVESYMAAKLSTWFWKWSIINFLVARNKEYI